VLIPEGMLFWEVSAARLCEAALLKEILTVKIEKRMAINYPVTLVGSVNPYRLEGQKTSAFEM